MVTSNSQQKRDWHRDLTGLPGYRKGNLRGIQGSGNELLVMGRALKHGFIVFFKAWPDTNYDIVLDYNGILFRVEVKGSKGNALNVTRGGRAGQQIRPEHRESRVRIVSRRDCDILIGVNANTGDRYVLPVDYITLRNQKSISFNQLMPFLERWDWILGNDIVITQECKNGLIGASKERSEQIIKAIGSSKSVKSVQDIYEQCPASNLVRQPK